MAPSGTKLAHQRRHRRLAARIGGQQTWRLPSSNAPRRVTSALQFLGWCYRVAARINPRSAPASRFPRFSTYRASPWGDLPRPCETRRCVQLVHRDGDGGGGDGGSRWVTEVRIYVRTSRRGSANWQRIIVTDPRANRSVREKRAGRVSRPVAISHTRSLSFRESVVLPFPWVNYSISWCFFLTTSSTTKRSRALRIAVLQHVNFTRCVLYLLYHIAGIFFLFFHGDIFSLRHWFR